MRLFDIDYQKLYMNDKLGWIGNCILELKSNWLSEDERFDGLST